MKNKTSDLIKIKQSRLFRLARLVFINFLILIVLIAILELSAAGAQIILGKKSLPLFFDNPSRQKSHKTSNFDPCDQMMTHPILSHSPNASELCLIRGGSILNQNFVVYENDGDGKEVILTLGGSTTSGFYQRFANGYTWPYLLSLDLADRNIKVINGAVGGYSSTMELLKLIIEGRRIKNLKLIVSLNGINDHPSYPRLRSDEAKSKNLFPFINYVQETMIAEQKWVVQSPFYRILPNLSNFISLLNRKMKVNSKYYAEKQSYPLQNEFNELSASERWRLNVISMNAISKAMGADYAVFVQPSMGLKGVQSVTKEGTNDHEIYMNEIANEPEYIAMLNKYYNEIRTICDELDYCFDISSVGPPEGSSYFNSRHHNAKGNKLISNAIIELLTESGKL